MNPKTKEIFDKIGFQIEECSKIGYIIVEKLTPFIWILPKAIICYLQYFTTDLGDDAFELPLYFWYKIEFESFELNN